MAVLPLFRPLVRLRAKTSLQQAHVLEVAEDEGANASKQVYFVDLPHPVRTRSADGHALVAPGSHDRA